MSAVYMTTDVCVAMIHRTQLQMALLRRAPHRYSAIAAEATRCLAIGRRALERLLGPAKHILQRDEAFAAQFMALRM